MKKTLWIVGILFVLGAVLLSACGGGQPAAESGGGSAPKLDRPAPPAEYAGKTNPKSGDGAAADAGKALFQTNCASCHGETGKGDGPAAASLNPKPQGLAETQAGLTDAYIYWRIAEGGTMDQFKSAMPAWKAVLSEEQIWQVITFIRTLPK